MEMSDLKRQLVQRLEKQPSVSNVGIYAQQADYRTDYWQKGIGDMNQAIEIESQNGLPFRWETLSFAHGHIWTHQRATDFGRRVPLTKESLCPSWRWFLRSNWIWTRRIQYWIAHYETNESKLLLQAEWQPQTSKRNTLLPLDMSARFLIFLHHTNCRPIHIWELLEVEGAYIVYDVCRIRGCIKGLAGDYEGALKDLDEAIKLRSDDVLALVDRGIFRFLAGDYKGAVGDLNVAIKHDPAQPREVLKLRDAIMQVSPTQLTRAVPPTTNFLLFFLDMVRNVSLDMYKPKGTEHTRMHSCALNCWELMKSVGSDGSLLQAYIRTQTAQWG